ncbi:MAG: MFS transporter [Thermoflexales bacterium]|nr:MFS transporter [Thermoflexales bacterium]MCS7324529.1 MFS transporter [Thermoflexales bacterium]MCX7939051.1 MFS transporter [Thermoflexales bacterium]MDW8053734.1 MFS transporter [Anaerolineae bacterium]MDW8293011.1 MFS transporter [Anaerolineae bacterium]
MTKQLLEQQQKGSELGKLLPVFVIVLVDLLGLTIIVPLLPLYAASFGATPVMIGLLGAAYPLMQALGAPLLGRLSDRLGRKPILMASQLGTFVSFMLLGFANALPMLFVARIINGLSGANIAAAQAVITDSTSEENRTQGLALIGAAFGIGFTIGPLLAFAALALSGNSYQAPAFAAAAFSLLSFLLTAFWLKESLPPKMRGKAKREALSLRAVAHALRHPVIGFLLLLMFAQQFIFGGMEHLLALFTLSRLGFGAQMNAVLFLFIGLITVIMLGGVIRVWSRQHSDRWIISVGLATLAVGMLLAALTPEIPPPWYSRAEMLAELQRSAERALRVALPSEAQKGWLGMAWIFVAMIPASVGGAVLAPTINSAITKRVAPTEVGGMLGVSASMVSLANASAPLIGSAIFQLIGPSAPFALGGVVLVVLLVLVNMRLTSAPTSTVPVDTRLAH